MSVLEALRAKRSEVAEAWSDLTLATYPAASAKLFVDEKDPFRNPVGATVRRNLAILVDALVGETSGTELLPALDGIVRLRAVQDFTASQAVGFVFLLKRVLRETLGGELESAPAEERAVLDGRIDELALQAFDVFTACRHRLGELRADAARARVHSLLKRAGMLAEEAGGGAAAEGEAALMKGGCPV